MKKYSSGFTVIELLFVTTIFAIASIFFFIQKNNVEVFADDNTKKTAINAIYYSLEEVFYPENKFYPQTIDVDILRAVDPDAFSDPYGLTINTSGSSYTYKATDCENSMCKGYTLTATLEKENDYTKKNRN